MSGPTVGFPTIDDVQIAYEGGSVQHLDVVYVIDTSAWVVVIPNKDNPLEPIKRRTIFPDLATFETDAEAWPEWTPGVIDLTTGTKTVVTDVCSTFRLDRTSVTGIHTTGLREPTIERMDRMGVSGIDVDLDPTTLTASARIA